MVYKVCSFEYTDESVSGFTVGLIAEYTVKHKAVRRCKRLAATRSQSLVSGYVSVEAGDSEILRIEYNLKKGD